MLFPGLFRLEYSGNESGIEIWTETFGILLLTFDFLHAGNNKINIAGINNMVILPLNSRNRLSNWLFISGKKLWFTDSGSDYLWSSIKTHRMKKLIYLVAFATITLAACKGNENKEAGGTTDSTSVPATNMATDQPADSTKHSVQYTCPMHPEVISDKPGQCPKCGMDLQVKSWSGTSIPSYSWDYSGKVYSLLHSSCCRNLFRHRM